MTAPITEKDIEALENDLKVLKPLHSEFETGVTKSVAARDYLKKDLKEQMDTAYKLYPEWSGKPEDLETLIRKEWEVARVKTDTLRADLKSGLEIIQPILKELE